MADLKELDPNGDVNSNLQVFFACFKAEAQANRTEAASRHNEFMEKFKELEVKYETLLVDHKLLKKSHKDLHLEFLELKSTVNDTNQQALSNNLLIRGVPELETEKSELPNIVCPIFTFLEAALPAESVTEISRIGRKVDGGPARPIIVKFSSPTIKESIIAAKRGKNLNCENISVGGKKLGSEADKIYVDEHLTIYNSRLFAAARKLKLNGKIKFVWVKNGQILLREKEKAPVHRIKHEGHISKLDYLYNGADIETPFTPTDTMDESDGDLPQKNRQKRKAGELSFAMARNLRQRTAPKDALLKPKKFGK